MVGQSADQRELVRYREKRLEQQAGRCQLEVGSMDTAERQRG